MILNVVNAAARLSIEYEIPQIQVEPLYVMIMVARSLHHSDSHELENVQLKAMEGVAEAFSAWTNLPPERYVSLCNAIKAEVDFLLGNFIAKQSSHKPMRARVRRTKPHTKE